MPLVVTSAPPRVASRSPASTGARRCQRGDRVPAAVLQPADDVAEGAAGGGGGEQGAGEDLFGGGGEERVACGPRTGGEEVPGQPGGGVTGPVGRRRGSRAAGPTTRSARRTRSAAGRRSEHRPDPGAQPGGERPQVGLVGGGDDRAGCGQHGRHGDRAGLVRPRPMMIRATSSQDIHVVTAGRRAATAFPRIAAAADPPRRSACRRGGLVGEGRAAAAGRGAARPARSGRRARGGPAAPAAGPDLAAARQQHPVAATTTAITGAAHCAAADRPGAVGADPRARHAGRAVGQPGQPSRAPVGHRAGGGQRRGDPRRRSARPTAAEGRAGAAARRSPSGAAAPGSARSPCTRPRRAGPGRVGGVEVGRPGRCRRAWASVGVSVSATGSPSRSPDLIRYLPRPGCGLPVCQVGGAAQEVTSAASLRR